ncbi:uncharacterized protein LOC100900564 [Galendromus occidentalis]|uniref:Uncharacterized protein LOC100900564 n=1 Tax=Galendromus occidentalis TaxID=34638 RepID=A0AAJ6QXG6_9ACAR|nr:uncharacterized protein LOC100900564 [Galendromus occidentalis]
MELKKINPPFPWRGRVVHCRAHRADRVKFDISLNESIWFDDDSDQFELSYRGRKRGGGSAEVKSILKLRDITGITHSENSRRERATVCRAENRNMEDIAAVMKFLKRSNRVPRVAFRQAFCSSEASTKDITKKLDGLVSNMLKEGYLVESVHMDMRFVEIRKTTEPQRLKLIPYTGEYTSCTARTAGDTLLRDDIHVAKGTLVTGLAEKVYSDGSVRLKSPPQKIHCGKRYEGIIDGQLVHMQCEERLKGDCWRVLLLRDLTYAIVPEENIKGPFDSRDTGSVRLCFVGRKPIPDKEFVARVEAMKNGVYFATMEGETFLSRLSVRSPRRKHLLARAIANAGEILLSRTDLEPWIAESFGVTLSEYLIEKPEILVQLNELQRFMISTYKFAGFTDDEYISTCDLACVLCSAEDPDKELLRELLLL